MSGRSVDGSDIVCSEAERLVAGHDEEMLRIHGMFFFFFSIDDRSHLELCQWSRVRLAIMSAIHW